MRYIPVFEILVILSGLSTIPGRVITSLFDFNPLASDSDPAWWDDNFILFGSCGLVISVTVELITRLATSRTNASEDTNTFILVPRIGLFLAGLIVVVREWLFPSEGPDIGGGAIYMLGAFALVSGIGLLTRYPFIKVKKA